MANIIFTPPIQGVSRGLPADSPAPNTSEYISNVRAIGLEKRVIVAQRPGLAMWSTDQVGDEEQPVVAMCTVASVA